MGIVTLLKPSDIQIITDVKKEEAVIQACIDKYGYMPEHHYHYLCCSEDNIAYGVMVQYNDYGWLGLEYSDMWEMIAEPMAPEEDRIPMLLKFLEFALLQEKAKKVFVEFTGPFRRKVLRALREDGRFHARKPCDVLHWPLFYMNKWDHTLSGGQWKKLRNIKNKFMKEHKVEFVSPDQCAKDELKAIVTAWGERRKGSDKANTELYLNMVEAGFPGFDMVRVAVIDGKPCAITGGWKVPNKNMYYSSLGVLNYNVDRLGDITNLDDLMTLKKRKYKMVDFGGGGKNMLEFKKKFKYHTSYKTFIFAIVTKEAQEQKNGHRIL